MAEIHNVKQRMPAILPRDARDTWLTGSFEEAYAALKPYERLTAHPVSNRVNSPKNNDAGLIEPLAANESAQLLAVRHRSRPP